MARRVAFCECGVAFCGDFCGDCGVSSRQSTWNCEMLLFCELSIADWGLSSKGMA